MLFFQKWLTDARKNLSLLKKAASQSNCLLKCEAGKADVFGHRGKRPPP